MFVDGKEIVSVFMSDDKRSFVLNATQEDGESVIGYICSFSPLAVTNVVKGEIYAISNDRSKIFCKDIHNWFSDANNMNFCAIPFVSSLCQMVLLSPCARFLLLVFVLVSGPRITVHCANTGKCVRVHEPSSKPVVVGWTKDSEVRLCWYMDGRVKGFLLSGELERVCSKQDVQLRCVFESKLLDTSENHVICRDDTTIILPLDSWVPFSIYNGNSLVASVDMPQRSRSTSLENDTFMIATVAITGAFIFCTKTGHVLHFVDLPGSRSVHCFTYFTAKSLLVLREPLRTQNDNNANDNNAKIQVLTQRTMQDAADTLLELTLLFYPALPPYVILHVYNCLLCSCVLTRSRVMDLDAASDYKHGGKIGVVLRTIKRLQQREKQKQTQKQLNDEKSE